ncbi:MAG: BatD family protein [Melioribacteraceae bacterium]|nr:BatD family protein [Melioribacteraceae bacterium]
MKNFIRNIVLLTVIFSVQTYAQKFEASVDRTTVGQNERFQVYFTLSDADINKAAGFRGPSFKGMKVLSGPNQSSSMQIINGNVSGSLTYSYIIVAPTTGEYEIGSAQINYDGSQFQTDPLKISVVQSSTQNQSKSSDDGEISEAELKKNVFITASVDKRNVYKGEQITVTYKLYTKLNISSPQISKLPSYKGFWAEDLEMSNTIGFNVEMYNGERYRAAVIKRAALFPNQTGELEITPFELTIPVQVRKSRPRSNSIFDEFFNDSFFGRVETVDFNAVSNKITISVKELPETGKPQTFGGAVGVFDFNASLSPSEVKANESITLTLNFSGKGNIKLLGIPEINLPAGFEKYDPKVSESVTKTNVVSGSKKIEYLFVPRIPGEKTIPAIEFSYFDPIQKRYVTKSAGPFTINVIEPDGSYETNYAAGFSKEDIKLLNEDIRYIKTSGFDLEKKSDKSTLPFWFWYSLLIPLFAFIVTASIKIRHDKLSGNVQLVKFQKAEKKARQRLKLAKKELDDSNFLNFYTEISKSLFGYLEDKLEIQKAEFTIDKAVHKLNELKVDHELIEELKRISDKCEFARFAPKESVEEDAPALYESTLQLIIKLDDSIPNKKKK